MTRVSPWILTPTARRHRDGPTNRRWFWALPTARQHGRRRSTRRLPPRSSPCSMPRFEYRRSNPSMHATQRGWDRAVDVHQSRVAAPRSRTVVHRQSAECPREATATAEPGARNPRGSPSAEPHDHQVSRASRSHPGYARRHPSRSARGAETRPHNALEHRRRFSAWSPSGSVLNLPHTRRIF
jgi:hypothetical protein